MDSITKQLAIKVAEKLTDAVGEDALVRAVLDLFYTLESEGMLGPVRDDPELCEMIVVLDRMLKPAQSGRRANREWSAVTSGGVMTMVNTATGEVFLSGKGKG